MGNSVLAEKLLDSQELLCSMELCLYLFIDSGCLFVGWLPMCVAVDNNA